MSLEDDGDATFIGTGKKRARSRVLFVIEGLAVVDFVAPHERERRNKD